MRPSAAYRSPTDAQFRVSAFQRGVL